ncbi:MAG: cytochrome c biogenesis protein CcsA [Phycisphaerales bacterium]
MPRLTRLLPALLLLCLAARSWGSDAPTRAWMDDLGTLATQDGGRVMPLETYARRLAVNVTGRERWSTGRGPKAYAGREPMELLCDLMFKGDALLSEPLVGVVNKPFKRAVGLDPDREFFSATELASTKGLMELIGTYQAARAKDPQFQASQDQRRAIDIFNATNRMAALTAGDPLPLVPQGPGKEFLGASTSRAAPGAEPVRDALTALADAYKRGADGADAVNKLRSALAGAGTLDEQDARSVRLEVFYDRHAPWRKTQVLYGLAILAFGVSRLAARKPLVVAAILLTLAGVAEHALGIGLRVAILHRAPVSNTFESLLWMGLVGIAVGAVAQLLSRKSYYLFGGVCAAFASVLFAGLVPLTDRTNSLPAVLRSNYWLTVHVLTIVASYGVLAVAAVLGHVYLIREVLLAKTPAPATGTKLSHPLILQTYRTIQVGLFLLTAGTILGGVWAADSWGRFWGWDPKETWALISIVVYFSVLHARYIKWLQDFGLAAWAVLGFVAIVWTFYGVNYVMATGLHSYGFGSGGEVWVALWAVAEIALLLACKWKHSGARAAAARAQGQTPAPAQPTP